MTPSNKVAFNTFILFIRMAITVFFSLYTTRLVLGALGTEDFGIFNVVGGVVAMLTFLNVSMAAATQRFMSYAEGKGDGDRKYQIFSVSITLHLIIALLLTGLLEIIGLFLFDGYINISTERIEIAKSVYQYAIISVIFAVISVPFDAVINSHENMVVFAIVSIIESILKLIVAFIIVESTVDKLGLYGILMAGIALCLLIIKICYCTYKYPECNWRVLNYFNKSLFKEMTIFAGWSLFGTSSSMLSNYGQAIVINIFFGARVNASHGISSQIVGLLSALAHNMQQALAPAIVKSEGEGNRVRMLQAAGLGNKIGFFLLALLYIPVLIEMPYLMKLWLIDVPPYAVVICRLLLIRLLVEQLFINLGSSISAVGDIKNYELITSLVTLCTLPVSYYLFSLGFSVISIYVVFIIYAIFIATITLFYAAKHCGLKVSDYLLNIVLKSVLAFSIILLVSSIPTLFLDESFFRILCVMSVFTTSFILSVWYVALIQSERIFFKEKLFEFIKILKSVLYNKFRTLF